MPLVVVDRPVRRSPSSIWTTRHSLSPPAAVSLAGAPLVVVDWPARARRRRSGRKALAARRHRSGQHGAHYSLLAIVDPGSAQSVDTPFTLHLRLRLVGVHGAPCTHAATQLGLTALRLEPGIARGPVMPGLTRGMSEL